MRQRGWTVEAWTAPPGDDALERAATALRREPQFAWLDSALSHPAHGRWSILAARPRWTLSARGRRICRALADGVQEFDGDPIAVAAGAIEAEQRAWAATTEGSDAPDALDLPFVGGAIGYLGFELARAHRAAPYEHRRRCRRARPGARLVRRRARLGRPPAARLADRHG